MAGYRSPLGRLLPDSPDVELIKRDGWRDEKILVVWLNDDRLDFVDREFVRRIGEKLYGNRKVFTSKPRERA